MSNIHIPESPWFSYRDGTLACEDVPLESIAAEVDTPAFVYSGAAIDDAYRSIDEALSFAPHLIAYAVKANASPLVLETLAAAGLGAVAYAMAVVDMAHVRAALTDREAAVLVVRGAGKHFCAGHDIGEIPDLVSL